MTASSKSPRVKIQENLKEFLRIAKGAEEMARNMESDRDVTLLASTLAYMSLILRQTMALMPSNLQELVRDPRREEKASLGQPEPSQEASGEGQKEPRYRQGGFRRKK